MKFWLKVLLILILFSGENKIVFSQSKGVKIMEITSSAFQNEGMVPTKYTCDGEDISPPLSWSDLPESTQSLALISDDPDAPMGTWVHWVIYNIPPSEKGFHENISKEKKLSNGSLQGITDFKRVGYGGPCPPGGTHRYYFKLYALNTKLNLEAGATKKQLLQAIEGHVLAQAELMGKYKRG